MEFLIESSLSADELLQDEVRPLVPAAEILHYGPNNNNKVGNSLCSSCSQGHNVFITLSCLLILPSPTPSLPSP